MKKKIIIILLLIIVVAGVSFGANLFLNQEKEDKTEDGTEIITKENNRSEKANQSTAANSNEKPKNEIKLFEDLKVEKNRSRITVTAEIKEEFKNSDNFTVVYGDGSSEEISPMFESLNMEHIYRETGSFTIKISSNGIVETVDINIDEIPIQVTDDNFKAGLIKKFQKLRTKNEEAILIDRLIYPSQAKLVKEFKKYSGSLNNKKIKEIKGIKHFSNLKLLSLENNNINNIEELKYLKELEQLYLKGNKIEDIKAISSLNQLEILDLSDNNIIELNPIKELENLKELRIENNKNEKLENINFANSKLKKLNKLYLENTNIKRIDLGNLDIKEITIKDSPVNDINFLLGLEKIEYIYLENIKIDNINVLSKLKDHDNLKRITINIPGIDEYNRNSEDFKVIEELKDNDIMVF